MEMKETLIDGKAHLRIDEVADYLRISKRMAYQLASEGELYAFKIRSCLRIAAGSVFEYIKKQNSLYKEKNE